MTIGRKSQKGGRVRDSRSLLVEHEVTANRRKRLDDHLRGASQPFFRRPAALACGGCDIARIRRNRVLPT